jgi:DNA (cytosine-5)-methyltransferase 1
MALGYSPDVAINHDREALAMHRANHPKTRHIRSNIKTVNFKRVMRGKPVGGAWFSPDCTYHSKARGGKPFRDRNKARRIRGLAWEMVRCAIQVRPRVLFMENVEEIEFWGPLDKRACRSPRSAARAGAGSSRGCANLGYVCEWRRLRREALRRADDAHAAGVHRAVRRPADRVAEGDARPGLQPYRTAAECIDFSLPVPSIFLNKRRRRRGARRTASRRRSARSRLATQRRIARGIMRFVIDSPEPFIIAVRHQDDSHVHSPRAAADDPAFDREFALVTPFLAPYYTTRTEGAEPARTSALTSRYRTI